MHEMSIAQNILEIIEEIQNNHPDYQIEKVHVEVGALVAVVPDSLQFCYQAITEGTPWQNSQLVIHTVPIKIFCNDCRDEITLDSFLFICPRCNGSNVKEISGRELTIKNLEVAE